MRGQFYSLIALVIMIPIFLFIVYSTSSSQETAFVGVDAVVADQQHQVAKNIEADLGRALTIIGKRALVSASNLIITNGTYIDNASVRLAELMENGTLYGGNIIVMFNNTLPDWRSRIRSIYTGFTTAIDYRNLRIQNVDGSTISFTVDLLVNVTDTFNRSRIFRIVPVSSYVSILDFEDPVFTIQSSGLTIRKIVLYPYPYFSQLLGAGSSRSGNCTGTISFDSSTPDANAILVAQSVSGASGFAGYVGETNSPPAGSCYVIGLANATALINATKILSGYSSLYIDQLTGVWSLPLVQGLTYYNRFPNATGSGFLARMEGRITQQDSGMETFVTPGAGITDKPNISRIDYMYFPGQTNSTKHVRGMPDWFVLDATNAQRYGLLSLWG